MTRKFALGLIVTIAALASAGCHASAKNVSIPPGQPGDRANVNGPAIRQAAAPATPPTSNAARLF